MHSGHLALWVPVDGRHEVFALSGPRVPRPVDCRSAHSKNALKPRSSRSQFARSPRFSPLLPSSRVSGDGSRSRAGHRLSQMRSRAAEPRSARSGHKTRLPPSVEAGVAEEPKCDTGPEARHDSSKALKRGSFTFVLMCLLSASPSARGPVADVADTYALAPEMMVR